LEWIEWRAGVINGSGLQYFSVNGVSAAVGPGDLGMVALNEVGDVGGDDELVSDRIDDKDPVIIGGEWVVYMPSSTWVISAYPLRGGIRRVSLRRWCIGRGSPVTPCSFVLFFFFIGATGGGGLIVLVVLLRLLRLGIIGGLEGSIK
jgi:hypothetical protein